MHHKVPCFFFFGFQWVTLINISQKNLIILILPPNLNFLLQKIVFMKELSFSHMYAIHFWSKDMGQTMVLLGNILGAHKTCNLSATTSTHCSKRNYIPNFVRHHFWPRLLQVYIPWVLVVIHINNFKQLWSFYFYFYLQWAVLIGPSLEKTLKL